MVLRPIEVHHVRAFLAQVLLNGGIPRQLLTNGMPGEVPHKLVPPFDLVLEGCGGFELVVAVVQARVVGADRFGEGRGLHVWRVRGKREDR